MTLYLKNGVVPKDGEGGKMKELMSNMTKILIILAILTFAGCENWGVPNAPTFPKNYKI